MPAKPMLLIEDNHDDADLVRLSLRKANILNELIIFESGKAALEYIHNIGDGDESNSKPVLIILDMGLPDMPGVEVLRSIRVHPATFDCRLIILTGAGEYEDLVTARQLGNNAFIQKGSQLPLEIRQFFDAGVKLGMWWLMLDTPPEGES